MVDLFPATIDFLENSARANSKSYFLTTQAEISSLPSYGVKHFRRFVDGVVEILDVHFGGAVKYAFINWLDFSPTAFDTAKWIVHCNFVRLRPVLRHHFHITRIESAVELNKCLIWGR